jgi:DNA invertase Pin-like site-specific DNA recombinase
MNNQKNNSTLDDITQNLSNIKVNTKSAIIYSRVSTNKQQFGTSLESQSSLCQDYCNLNKFNVIKTIQEICSATSMSKQLKLNDIMISHNNFHLIVLEPSRLCRNIKDFTSFLNKCEQRNITLHFVQSITISNNSQDIKRMISHVYDAELESKTLSQRIKRSVYHRKKMKTYIPSVPSFGYIVENKKLCLHKKEQEIIDLINKLFWGSNTSNINDLLFKITGNADEICDLYDDDEIFEVKYGNMRIVDIVSFLNNTGITCRGREWRSNSVSKLIKEKPF